MKNKIFLFLLAVGFGLAGCSSSREGQGGADTLMNGIDTISGDTIGNTNTDTIDTAGMRSGTADTTGIIDTTISPQ